MEDSRQYETARYIVSAIGFSLTLALLVVLLGSGLSVRIRNFAAGISSTPSLIVLIYFLVIGVFFTVVQLPLDFISGFHLEHRFGLSRQPLGAWIRDQMKELALGSVFGLAGAELVYFLLRTQPDHWWVYASILFILLFVVLANLAPVLLLPLFYKFTPVENDDLLKRVNRLAAKAGTRVRGIFEWSLGDRTRKANAAVVGWGNTRRIIVSDTLLRNFSPEELEVIMAHELCHHVKAHVWLGMALQGGLTFVTFYVIHDALHRFGSRFAGISDVANFPLLAITGLILSLLALPLINAFSRRMETAADNYALEITGDALAFVSSMEKLADLNLANRSPNRVIEFLFYSHPSIEQRIRLAADRVGQFLSG